MVQYVTFCASGSYIAVLAFITTNMTTLNVENSQRPHIVQCQYTPDGDGD